MSSEIKRTPNHESKIVLTGCLSKRLTNDTLIYTLILCYKGQ